MASRLSRLLTGPTTDERLEELERREGEPTPADRIGDLFDAVAEGTAAIARELAPAAELEARAPDHPTLDEPWSRPRTVLALRPLRARPPRARPACRTRARGRRERRTVGARGPPDDGESDPPPPGVATPLQGAAP